MQGLARDSRASRRLQMPDPWAKVKIYFCGLKKSPQPSLHAISRFWRKFCSAKIDRLILVNQSEAISTRTRYFKSCAQTARVRDLSSQSFASFKCEFSFKRLKMERNSFKEYSVLAMVSKEPQRPKKSRYNFVSPRSRHCLTQRSSHGRPQQHKPTFG